MHRCAPLILLCCTLLAVSTARGTQAQAAGGQEEQDALKRADAAFRGGFTAMQAGHLEEARVQFTEAAKLAPQIPEGHEALGEVLIELGKPAEAVPEFEAALRLKPADEGIESNLALAYAKTGEVAKAIPQFSAAYQASSQPGAQPVDAEFLQAYGRALAAVGRSADAIPMFQAAIDRGSATADAYDALGSLYAQGGQWGQAQMEFERALRVDGTFMPARIHLGIVQREQRNLDGAVSSLYAATTQDPKNALAQGEYGRTLAAAGQDEAASAHLEQAAQLDPNLAGVQNDLAMAL